MEPGARILVLGADGFIGRHILFRLRARGYLPVGCARRVSRLEQMGFDTLKLDLMSRDASDPAFWKSALAGVGAVINAAGLLTGPHAAFRAVHLTAPRALYEAAGTRPCLLLSAVGIDDATTPFAQFRREAETIAAAQDVTVLRAGLVLADTSFGGSSVARGLSALPFVLPVIDEGHQVFNPIHADDLADVMLHALGHPGRFEIGGPEDVTLLGLLTAYRGWFGLPTARILHLPAHGARLIGKVGDALRLGPISATAVDQLATGVHAETRLPDTTSTQPRAFSTFHAARPSGTQDLWHARLYLLRPVLRITLALLWLVSGILGLTLAPQTFLPLVTTALPDGALIAAARIGGVVDIALAVALLRGWRPRLTAALQAVMVAGYTLGFTLLAPALWLLPLGGLLKNIPILALIAVSAILEDER